MVGKKILLISAGDTYGAYEYMYRMAKCLLTEYYIALAVADKKKTDPWVIRIPLLQRKKKLLKRGQNFVLRKLGIKKPVFETLPQYVFLPNEDENIQFVTADDIIKCIPFIPDIIISGMTDGFINSTTLYDLHNKTGARVYQDTIDMSVLTGGCHVVWDCNGFEKDCSNCPAINDKKFSDYAANNLALKKKNIELGNFTLFTDPGWTYYQACKSAIYKNRTKIITSSIIDTNIFSNVNRGIAKQIFGISLESKIIFAGSNNAKDIKKGRAYLVEALSILWEILDITLRNNITILLAGNHNTEDEISSQIKFNKKLIDFISDDRLLSLAYQASDIFACPSLEDGGPSMVAEALACGTPVVGFEMGMLFNDHLVQNGMNGYRIKMKDTRDFADAFKKIIMLEESEFRKMSDRARTSAVHASSKQAFLESVRDI